jgi:hypothetical protein
MLKIYISENPLRYGLKLEAKHYTYLLNSSRNLHQTNLPLYG